MTTRHILPLLIFLAGSLGTQAIHAETLYKPADYRSLVADRKAFRVGDVLTVLVIENATASASAGTKTDKSTDLGVHASTPKNRYAYGVGIDDGFDGNGKSARTGKLLAQVSVRVTDIEPNGDLRIRGEQYIEINEEKQTINLEGIVRSADIGDGNTVPSNRVGNARITYVGDGALSDSQSRGWISRILSAFLRLL